MLPKRRTPWAAIVATTLVAMLLTLTGDLSTLAETVVLLLTQQSGEAWMYGGLLLAVGIALHFAAVWVRRRAA